METAFFWIIWGIVSIWALKTFYFSFSREKLEGLRKTSIGLTISVLILTLLPWVPPDLGGLSAVGLALGANFLSIVLFILLTISLIFLFQKEYLFLKIAAVLTVLETLVVFILMASLRPGSFSLSLYDIAPIVAVLILLVLNVVMFLLWQQMQLSKKDEVIPTTRKKINAVIVSLIPIILGAVLVVSGSSDSSVTPIDYTGEQDVAAEYKEGIEVFAQQEAGVVCFGEYHYSFQMDMPYTILSDDATGMAFTTGDLFVTVSVGIETIENKLSETGIDFTKEGDLYKYEMPADNTQEERTFGLSQKKDRFVTSVFYTEGNEDQAKQIMSAVLDSLQEGTCN